MTQNLRNVRSPVGVIVLAMLFAVGCFSDAPDPNDPAALSGANEIATAQAPVEAEGEAAIFGTEDTVCQSVRLRNEDDDLAKATGATDCLLAEIGAGRAVTVDIAAITTEGDPIYMRYAFDGETTLIVEDNRADTFGSGSVRVIRCKEMRGSAWLPEGFDCQGDNHPGFPEAVSQ